jgi:hypothetical protein
MRTMALQRLLGPVRVIALMAFAGGCMHPAESPGASSLWWPSTASDSIRAVNAAKAELAETVHDGPWIVAAFVRDTGGVVISLAPVREGLGGGGQVRVSAKGDARVTELYQ